MQTGVIQMKRGKAVMVIDRSEITAKQQEGLGKKTGVFAHTV
jgi:hypothetical protein